MSKYSHESLTAQAAQVTRSGYGDEEPRDVEAAMEQHEGLIHAFIRRQGGALSRMRKHCKQDG